MTKYLGIKFKSGEYKKYEWDKINFSSTVNSPYLLVVRELESDELLLATTLDNIEYQERIEGYYGNQGISN